MVWFCLGITVAIVTRCLQDTHITVSGGEKLFNLTAPPLSMSEDCLYLNIYTPAHAHERSSLPVSVKPRSAWVWEDISSPRLEGGVSKIRCDLVIDICL